VSALTEALVLDLLRQRHTASGNGGAGEHAFLTQVRNDAGFDATRTFDAVAVNLWPSRGLAISVFEVKISRADWRRELAKPSKAEAACAIADRFWIVAPARAVHTGELPPTWGLIEVHGDGNAKPWRLSEHTPAPRLHRTAPAERPMPRGLVVGMLRAAPGAIPGGKVPGPGQDQLDREYQRGYGKGRNDATTEAKQLAALRESTTAAWADFRAALERAGAGKIATGPYVLINHVDAIAAALNGAEVQQRLVAARDTVERALHTLQAAIVQAP
jgi:hypothetical protein